MRAAVEPDGALAMVDVAKRFRRRDAHQAACLRDRSRALATAPMTAQASAPPSRTATTLSSIHDSHQQHLPSYRRPHAGEQALVVVLGGEVVRRKDGPECDVVGGWERGFNLRNAMRRTPHDAMLANQASDGRVVGIALADMYAIG